MFLVSPCHRVGRLTRSTPGRDTPARNSERRGVREPELDQGEMRYSPIHLLTGFTERQTAGV